MRRSIWMSLATGLGVGFLGTIALAQYRPPPVQQEKPSAPEEEEFEEALDLRRFRKGHYHRDTQELIAAGFKELHREHERILQELAELRASVQELEGER